MPRNGEAAKYKKKESKDKAEKLAEESKRITEEATKLAIEALLAQSQTDKTEGSSWANYSGNIENIDIYIEIHYQYLANLARSTYRPR